MTRFYRVADFFFSIDATEPQFSAMPNLVPFCVEKLEGELLFSLCLTEAVLPDATGWEEDYTDRSDEDMPRIEMYRRGDERLFRISCTRDSEIVCTIRMSEGMRHADVYCAEGYTRFAIDNAAMLLYAFTTVDRMTLLFHSSVTVLNGKACLFLGHSGTGKSTHSKQWSLAFPDSWLLNDDNPVVRIIGDEVRVYGSPWSGKTPCYKQASAPVAALVQLAQAPQNTISLLKMSQAYPYLLSSVSGLKLEPAMMDALYGSIARLLELTPVYYLRCLPNEEAARLCAQTCLS